MAPAVLPHHHRSTTKSAQKPFKAKFASKGALRDLAKGKVEGEHGKRDKRPFQKQIMSKIERRHHARQQRQNKHREHVQATNVFAGQNAAPRIVTVVPLTSDVILADTVRHLIKSLELEVEVEEGDAPVVRIERFKQSVQFVQAQSNLLGTLDACRVSDFVLLVLSATTEVDEGGEQLLRAIEMQGVSNVLTVVSGLEIIEPPKKRPQVLASLKSFISHFFPGQEKLSSLGSSQECSNIIRSLCTTTPKGIRWREDRSWMLVEEVRWDAGDSPDQKTAVLTGVVRGKGLKANRLLQIGDWGDFQIAKITSAPSSHVRKRKADDMTVDEEIVLDTPDETGDDLGELAPVDINMETESMAPSEQAGERKGVLLDDHHYFSEDEKAVLPRPKRLPKGTSDYQSAWYLEDVSDSGSDFEDEDMDADKEPSAPGPRPEDGMEGMDRDGMDQTVGGPSEYPESEMFVDPSPEDEAEELAAYRENRKNDADEDLEFPDEIELHPNVLARERLARYRGLKSLRTSRWETDEDRGHEPEDWNRLLQVPDYKGTRARITREALVGGVQPGTRVHVYVKAVPARFESASSQGLLTAFSLLRHEHKQTVMNFSITLNSDYPEPLKSKEELILQCGPRRLVVRPLFSASGNTPNDVHKFDRFLHPGRTAMATAIGPVIWGPVPMLVFQRTSTEDSQELELIGSGTAAPPSSGRVIAKRVILTGHPYKIHKKLVTVRYMFFNTEDVQWFKPLQLWTRRGRSGYIKESLGTHGYFKATFDQRINPQDAVGISLYKRMFPRRSRQWTVDDAKAVHDDKGKGKRVVGEEMAVE